MKIIKDSFDWQIWYENIFVSLQVILLIMKILGIIKISWFLVFMPIIFSLGFLFLALANKYFRQWKS